jgi:tRNA (guanine-N7-)-methyltransferase
MYGNSRQVTSSQSGIHASLEGAVKRHLHTTWQKPVADHSRMLWQHLDEWRQRSGIGRPLWLDSGCGTGRSALQLAEAHPECLVIGVDQSAVRLEKGRTRFPGLPDNLLLVRAECADLWRLMVAAGWRLERHFLLYPNPWPKPGHLHRRWHGHPVFPTLVQLGGELDLRSNWSLYPAEMAVALDMAGKQPQWGPWHPRQPLTDFEQKYLGSGHGLWRLTCCLN